MEIILREDIIGLGYKNDIVNVKSGYGRNYLIPTGKAIIASESAKKVLAENLNPVSLNNYKVKTVFGDYKATQVSEAGDDEYYTTMDTTASTERDAIDDYNNGTIRTRSTTTSRKIPITARDRAATLKR